MLHTVFVPKRKLIYVTSDYTNNMEIFKLSSWINMFLVLNMHAEHTSEASQKAETKLYNTLLSSSNIRVRPVLNANDAVHINVSITLANVLDIDEKHQSLTTLLWIYTEWVDLLLAWNETEFPGINYLAVQADEIWTADLIVYNALGNTVPIAAEYLRRSEGVKVYPSGIITHWCPVLLKSYCPMNIEHFPFDVYSCPITLASWVYDASKLQLSPTEKFNVAVLGTSQWEVSKDWIVNSFTGRKSVIIYEDLGGSSAGSDQMDFSITLKRKSTFYVFNLLVPCYLISIIACLCYAIPPQGGDRISLLLSTFLAIAVFVLVVLEIVPEESASLPLFSRFLLMVMLLNMLQLVYCTFVCRLQSMDQICFGPPKCLVTLARHMTRWATMTTQLHQKCPTHNKLKWATLQGIGSKMIKIGDIQENTDSCNKINVKRLEINTSRENAEVAPDIPSTTNGADDKNTILRGNNIEKWRLVMKALDAMLFIINILGLTGYFIGILVIYN